MRDKDRIIRNYQKNLAKLEQKPAETYDIKTPEPNNKHTYCQVCGENFQNYKGHVTSDSHRSTVQKDKLYNEIDNLID